MAKIRVVVVDDSVTVRRHLCGVLDGDPAEDIRALARVRATLRAGRVIYRRP